MKTIAFFSLLLFATNVYAESPDSLGKTGTIVQFKVEYFNPGVEESAMLMPIHQALNSLFKFDELIDLQDPSVNWMNGNWTSMPSRKKVKPADMEKVNAYAPKTDMMFVIRVDHAYNAILGGLLHGRRHVIRVSFSGFNRQGKRVWYIKKKGSCCEALGKSAEEEGVEPPMSSSDFYDLYKEVLEKIFGSK